MDYLKLAARIVIGALALLGAFYVAVTIFVTFFIDACSSYTLVELASPTKEYSAAITLRSCADESFEELNIYVTAADADGMSHGAPLVKNPKTTEVYLEWRYDNVLVIHHPTALRIENRPSTLGDVQIEFRETRDIE